jgi:hypothetical protein
MGSSGGGLVVEGKDVAAGFNSAPVGAARLWHASHQLVVRAKKTNC